MPVTSVPCAPGRLPLAGHVHRLLRDPVGLLQALRDEGPIAAFHLGRRPVYVVNSPELLRRVLVTDAGSYVRGLAYERSRPILGDGLATSDGEAHLRQRRLMLPSFHRARLLGYTGVMRAQAEVLAGTWRDGQRVAMDRALHRTSAAGALRALFRTDLDDATVAEIDDCVTVFLEEIPLRAVLPRFAERLPTPGNRRFARVAARLRRIVDGMVEERRRDPRARDDLLSMLMAARDEDTGAAMTPRQVRDEVVTILAGGSETVPSTLSWLYYELGRDPSVQERLQDELDLVLEGRPAGFDDLPRLAYTRRVIDETLRLHSVAWMMSRRARTDAELGGHRIPAGAELLFSPTTLHRDPVLYPDPLRFDPDRWISPPPRENFVPFGAGPRKCIGDHFSYIQMTVIVATVSARWSVSGVPGSRVRERPAGALRPDVLPMTVSRRDPRSHGRHGHGGHGHGRAACAAASAAPASTVEDTTSYGV
ncbi:cytochrome P450 [Actinomadura rubrisoli]|uniref:Cytochrome P450 n=1 Tax=Actinomadura rubrisoli TaxID=2530368 RepID=A0A4R5C6R7_9ACTN|nr:cytochrome P450 [Actinomadura rubrisoli]TDD94765.1 cytochrome P450 [Actinomadura rubrisoli]